MLPSALLVLALVKASSAAYVLQQSYTASNFFSQFNFFTGRDPTNGYVTYVDRNTAQNNGLINTNNNQIYVGVDSRNVASGSGRQSVRLESTTQYNRGLFILDLAHMPGSVCGIWPAFWMFGPDWPNSGEIDIIEGVHTQANNAYTLHTSDGCTITNTGAFSGTLTTSNCYVNAPGQGANVGCNIQDTRSNTYGDGFNANGGGVFATQWTSSVINIWYFNGRQIPANIQQGNPDPNTWGRPAAQFRGNCDINAKFRNLNIVFDITFCGDWAGNVWSSTPSCSGRAPTCQQYVQNNPGAFAPAYWLINSLKVYRDTTNSLFGAAISNSTIPPGDKPDAPLTSDPLAMGGGLPPSKLRRNVVGAL